MPTLAELSMAAQYGGQDFQNQDWASILKAIQNYDPAAYDQNYSGWQGITGNDGWIKDEYQPDNGLIQLTKAATNQTNAPGGYRRMDTVLIDPKTGQPTQQWQQQNAVSGGWLDKNLDWLGPMLVGGIGLAGATGLLEAGTAGADAAATGGAGLGGVGNLDAYVAANTATPGALSTGGTLVGSSAAGSSIPTAEELATGGFGTGGMGITGVGGATSVAGAGAGAAGYGAADAAATAGVGGLTSGVTGSTGGLSSLVGQIPGGYSTLGSLLSGALGAGASLHAGNVQADAANNAVGLQKYIYDQTSQNVAPWLNAGKSTLGTLMSGVQSGQFNPTPYTATANLSTVGPAPTFQTVANAPKLTSYGSVGDMKAYQDYVAKNPYTGPGAWDASKFQSDPGYQFQLQQGLDALTNKASLAGGMNSNNLKGLIGFAQGLANTDYQQAFQNYQTEANRGLNEYQTNLQDYMQQFQLGQNVNTLNNQLTQQKYQDMMSTTAANNQNINQDLLNSISAAGFNNTWSQTGFEDTLQGTAFNNNVAQQGFQNANTTTGLNNQNTQQQFSNLAQLSQVGLGAGLGVGSIGADYAKTAGGLMTDAAAAKAAGTMGSANAIAGSAGNAYNTWLQQQYLQLLKDKLQGGTSGSFDPNSWLGSNASILSQGVSVSDLYGLG